MGTVCFEILNIHNPIPYFTNLKSGKIPVLVYTFSEEANKLEAVTILIIYFVI